MVCGYDFIFVFIVDDYFFVGGVGVGEGVGWVGVGLYWVFFDFEDNVVGDVDEGDDVGDDIVGEEDLFVVVVIG